MKQKREKKQKQKQSLSQAEKIQWYAKMGQWFQTLCLMHIPFFGFFYMLVKALRKDTPPEKKAFAIAYVLYRLLVLLLACTVLFILYRVGLSFIDGILEYAGDV